MSIMLKALYSSPFFEAALQFLMTLTLIFQSVLDRFKELMGSWGFLDMLVWFSFIWKYVNFVNVVLISFAKVDGKICLVYVFITLNYLPDTSGPIILNAIISSKNVNKCIQYLSCETDRGHQKLSFVTNSIQTTLLHYRNNNQTTIPLSLSCQKKHYIR